MSASVQSALETLRKLAEENVIVPPAPPKPESGDKTRIVYYDYPDADECACKFCVLAAGIFESVKAKRFSEALKKRRAENRPAVLNYEERKALEQEIIRREKGDLKGKIEEMGLCDPAPEGKSVLLWHLENCETPF